MMITRAIIGFSLTMIFSIIISWAYKTHGHIGWGIFAGCVMGGVVGIIILLFERMHTEPGET